MEEVVGLSPTPTSLNAPSREWIIPTGETLLVNNLLLQIFKGCFRNILHKYVPEMLNSVDIQELDPMLVDLFTMPNLLCCINFSTWCKGR